ncbi:hypothetical protein [Janthinobacterium aquaticum]|uniref:hypothetical protein n=1 Tax=Janthinobacterium sp. FT58W TaxID=2654254 RepID=UPI001264BF4C|nr:hypothetical protein [Janthinobacterium sp. FT58W]KAB8039305.1 hypothetical protein GCM43_21235 [Janthinobacterium sp. FT58W]
MDFHENAARSTTNGHKQVMALRLVWNFDKYVIGGAGLSMKSLAHGAGDWLARLHGIFKAVWL